MYDLFELRACTLDNILEFRYRWYQMSCQLCQKVLAALEMHNAPSDPCRGPLSGTTDDSDAESKHPALVGFIVAGQARKWMVYVSVDC